MQNLVTFLACFLPGVCLGYALCALIHNRRRPVSNRHWKRTGIFDLHNNNNTDNQQL